MTSRPVPVPHDEEWMEARLALHAFLNYGLPVLFFGAVAFLFYVVYDTLSRCPHLHH